MAALGRVADAQPDVDAAWLMAEVGDHEELDVLVATRAFRELLDGLDARRG